MTLHARFAMLASGLLVAYIAGCGSRPGDSTTQRRDVTLLTTTSAQDTGLLDVLKLEFEKRTGYELKAISTGTGAALKQAAQGEGDVVFVHDPEAEKKWLAESNGTSRRLVMYNDFILVGPAEDSARIKGQPAVEAMKRIAAAQALFVSRGDQSGTHVRELSLWTKAGVHPKGAAWYQETGAGQGQTLQVASEKRAYALTDRGTFLVHQKRLELALLVQNDSSLFNLYHVMPVNSQRFPKVNAKGGQAFADYLVSPEAQQLIAAFGKEKYGQSLFVPAADRKEEDLQPP